MTMTWNKKETEDLVVLWKGGKGLSEIMSTLGKTKGGILGKVARLGLSNRKKVKEELTKEQKIMAMNELDMCMDIRESLLRKRKGLYDKLKATPTIRSQIVACEAYLKLIKEVERLRLVIIELGGEDLGDFDKRKQESNERIDGRVSNGIQTSTVRLSNGSS